MKFLIRWLGALCALLAVATAVDARILIPVEPNNQPFELRSQTINIRVEGPQAVTTLKQVFHNPNPRDLEGTFLLPLPSDALVSDFQMVINGVVQKAEALPKDEAKRIYTEIVRRMVDPGLLEYVDGNTFRVSVYPIPANGDMPIEISFTQPLKREGGLYAYDFMLSTASDTMKPRESDLTATVKWNTALGSVLSPTHGIDVDFKEARREASVRLKANTAHTGRFRLLVAPEQGGPSIYLLTNKPLEGRDGTFMMVLAAPSEIESAQTPAKTMVLVMDVSGSMSGAKIEQARQAARQLIAALPEKDSFNILTFSTTVESLFDKPMPASGSNLEDARRFIDAIVARGGTALDEALTKAVTQQVSDQLTQILFLTDGQPTVGETNPDRILANLQKANGASLRVFTFGVGFDVNTRLLDSVADSTRALSVYVAPEEDLEIAVSTLYDSVARPMLTNIELAVEGVALSEVFPRPMPDLFAGRDIRILGKYATGGKGKVTVSGKLAGEAWSQTFDLDFPTRTDTTNDSIESLWASRKVGFLLDEIRRNGETAELKDEVIALAEKHRLVTPYTSFLVREDEMRIMQPALAMTDGRGRQSTVANWSMIDTEAGAFDAAPGTTSRGDLFRSPAPAASATSGESAVRFAREMSALKSADAPVSASEKDMATRRIGERRFEFQEGGWKQAGEELDELPTIKIKYLSDAWFALHEKHEEIRDVLQLGEKVQFEYLGTLIIIGEDGEEDPAKLPDRLRK
jgi:Ca-activated chloride channel family protein